MLKKGCGDPNYYGSAILIFEIDYKMLDTEATPIKLSQTRHVSVRISPISY